jgi:hypothetical protein
MSRMGGGRGLMKRSFLGYAMILMIAVFAFIFGCEKTFIGLPSLNKSPEVWLSSGPVEGTTTGYQVHFPSDSIMRIPPGSINGREHLSMTASSA